MPARPASILLATFLSLSATAAKAADHVTQSPAVETSVAGQWEGDAQPADGWPTFLLLHLDQTASGTTAKLSVLGKTIDLPVVVIDGIRFTAALTQEPDGLKLEGRIEQGRLAGKLTEAGRTLPFALARVPSYPKPANRIEAWTQDVDALATRFPKVERSFTPATRATFAKAIADLRRRLPALDDQQIMTRMAAAMALPGNAHTRLYLVRVRTRVRMMPIRLWWFADGPRIVRTAPEQAALLGCRIASFDGKSAERARAAVAPLYAGTASWTDYMTSYTLVSPDILHGVGVSPSADRVTLGLADCAAAGPVTLTALPLVPSNSTIEAWWDLAQSGPGDSAWPQVLAKRDTATPLYLKHPDQYYWHAYLPESGTLYFQYNRAAQMPSESTGDYAKRLLAAFDEHPVKAFVLDLRFNTGGDTGLAAELMSRLRDRTTGMPRFVIVGRGTFSAGIAHAAKWRELPDVRIVGEPVGDALDFWSEGGNINLPNSGLAAHFANGPHSYSPAPCQRGLYCQDASAPNLTPDLPAVLRWSDYAAGRDPAMTRIAAALLSSRR